MAAEILRRVLRRVGDVGSDVALRVPRTRAVFVGGASFASVNGTRLPSVARVLRAEALSSCTELSRSGPLFDSGNDATDRDSVTELSDSDALAAREALAFIARVASRRLAFLLALTPARPFPPPILKVTCLEET